MDHLIKVGADGLTYTPSSISAAVGDTVTFEFHPKNHTGQIFSLTVTLLA
jgi:plastocyanin